MSEEKKTLRQQWEELDGEEKVAAGAVGVVALVFLLLILLLIFELLKALFIPALIALALYSAGVKWLGWPVPPFVKKFYR